MDEFQMPDLSQPPPSMTAESPALLVESTTNRLMMYSGYPGYIGLAGFPVYSHQVMPANMGIPPGQGQEQPVPWHPPTHQQQQLPQPSAQNAFMPQPPALPTHGAISMPWRPPIQQQQQLPQPSARNAFMPQPPALPWRPPTQRQDQVPQPHARNALPWHPPIQQQQQLPQPSAQNAFMRQPPALPTHGAISMPWHPPIQQQDQMPQHHARNALPWHPPIQQQDLMPQPHAQNALPWHPSNQQQDQMPQPHAQNALPWHPPNQRQDQEVQHPAPRMNLRSRVVQVAKVTEIKDAEDSDSEDFEPAKFTRQSRSAAGPSIKQAAAVAGPSSARQSAAAGPSTLQASTQRQAAEKRKKPVATQSKAVDVPGPSKRQRDEPQHPMDDLANELKQRKLSLAKPQKKAPLKSYDAKALTALEEAFPSKKPKKVTSVAGSTKRPTSQRGRKAAPQEDVEVEDEDDPEPGSENQSTDSEAEEADPPLRQTVTGAKFSADDVINISSDEGELSQHEERQQKAPLEDKEPEEEGWDWPYPRMMSPEPEERKDFDCCICECFWKAGDFKGVLDCGHSNFCYHCIVAQQLNNFTCPLCYKVISHVTSEVVA